MQCSQCSPVSCCPPVTPATRDVLRKCQITKKLSQYVIHVHPLASPPPGSQSKARRWSWEGCNSSNLVMVVSSDLQLLLVDHLASSHPSLLSSSGTVWAVNVKILSTGSSQRVFTYPVNEGRPHGSSWLVVAGEFPTWFLVFYQVVTVMTELA